MYLKEVIAFNEIIGVIKMFVTYKIICTVTGKYYIGSHKTDNIDDEYMGSGKFIRDSIAMYGIKNHVKEILGVFETRKESLELEHALVKEKKAQEKEKCLNATNGGCSFDYINITGKNVYKRTPEQKQAQIRLLKKGLETIRWRTENIAGYKEERQKRGTHNLMEYFSSHPSPWIGKHHTEKTKLKMHNSNIGKHCGTKNGNFGKYWITNGYTSTMWSDSRGEIPDGYWRGRKM